MKYIDIVKQSVDNGADSSVMWRSVEVMSNILEDIKGSHPEMYECYMRMLTEAINGPHFNEEMAKRQVASMHHTDAQGVVHNGEYWSPDEIENITAGKSYPAGTTIWDKYVAMNAAYHDFANLFDEPQIISIANALFFCDEDYMPEGKVWKYFQMS